MPQRTLGNPDRAFSAPASVAADRLPLPERGELRHDYLVVFDFTIQHTDLAREPAGVRDHVLGDRRLVEGGIASRLECDETGFLGRKHTFRSLHGELRISPERSLSLHDGPHG